MNVNQKVHAVEVCADQMRTVKEERNQPTNFWECYFMVEK